MAKLLTMNEVAEQIGVSLATVTRYCGSGDLPSVKLAEGRRGARRVDPNDLAAFLARKRAGKPPQS